MSCPVPHRINITARDGTGVKAETDRVSPRHAQIPRPTHNLLRRDTPDPKHRDPLELQPLAGHVQVHWLHVVERFGRAEPAEPLGHQPDCLCQLPDATLPAQFGILQLPSPRCIWILEPRLRAGGEPVLRIASY